MRDSASLARPRIKVRRRFQTTSETGFVVLFRACNMKAAVALAEMPATHEAALDFGFVTKAAEFSAPVRFPSDKGERRGLHCVGAVQTGCQGAKEAYLPFSMSLSASSV